MHIEHIALWTGDLERLREFYERYFQAHAGPKYVNQSKQFESYFLSFSSGARLELMRTPARREPPDALQARSTGYAHLAIALGSEENVDALTSRLRADGYRVVDEPRRTGDGYYESCVLDPDGNRIELTV